MLHCDSLKPIEIGTIETGEAGVEQGAAGIRSGGFQEKTAESS
jgi:hypothetical protein